MAEGSAGAIRILPSPTPARWLAGDPADRDEQGGDHDEVENEPRRTRRCVDRDDARADERDVAGDDQPSLPGVRNAPAPAVLLRWKPVVRFGHDRTFVSSAGEAMRNSGCAAFNSSAEPKPQRTPADAR